MVDTPETHSPGDDRLLVRAIIASQFAAPFMFSGVAVGLPSLGKELSAGATSLGLVETLFLAGGLAFLLPVGKLADASDTRTIYKWSLVGFALTAILIGSLNSLPLILALRFLQGGISAAFSVTGPAILAEIVPAPQRGRAYGASIGVIYAGLTLGPVVAGYLVDFFSWRAVFHAGAAMLLLAYVLVRWKLPSRWVAPEQPPIHLPSALLVLASVVALVGGTSFLHFGVAGYAAIALGIALAVVFVVLQRRIDSPLVDVDAMMRNLPLRSSLFIQFLLYSNGFCSIFMLNLFTQVSLGHTAKAAGQVIALGSVLMAIVAPYAGSLSDRASKTALAAFGVAGVLAATLLGLLLHAESSRWAVGLVVAVQGVGFALFSSPNMALIMNSVPPEEASIASALGAKARSLGTICGMLITALLISIDLKNDPVTMHPIEFIATMHRAFYVLAVLTALALVVAVTSRRGQRVPRSTSPSG